MLFAPYHFYHHFAKEAIHSLPCACAIALTVVDLADIRRNNASLWLDVCASLLSGASEWYANLLGFSCF